VVDLSRLENWEKIYEQSKTSSDYNAKYGEISKFIIPISFLSPYFKIFASTPSGKINWFFAGWLVLYVGSVEERAPAQIATKDILLNEWQILIFPEINLSINNHLSFSVPYWIFDMNIVIYQYVEDSLEQE